MPSSADILAELHRLANEAVWLAMVWHGVVLMALAFVHGGWRPPKRLGAAMLVAPLVSVAILAWSYGNPFNGSVFLVASLALAMIAWRMPMTPVAPGPRWARFVGLAGILFGWVYPHFLETDVLRSYLYAAPLGLIPCPTLTAVIGFTLLADGFRSRAWTWVLAGLGVFYGLFGVVRLGVYLDIGLLVAAGAVAVHGLRMPRRPRTPLASAGTSGAHP